MSDAETRFHEAWLGMVQPIEGLVVSLPVLVEAQCMERQPPAVQQRFLEHLVPLAALNGTALNGTASNGTASNGTASNGTALNGTVSNGTATSAGAASPLDDAAENESGSFAIADLPAFLTDLLQLNPELFDQGDEIPDDLALYVPEGGQTLRPSLALRKLDGAATSAPSGSGQADDSTPASRAGARYVAFLWDLPPGLPLDKAEAVTGAWEYPPAAKLDRLLRHCRVPIGILTNRTELRLVYAPHGESSGHLTFRVNDMATVGGRPILDALIMLLSATRFFGVAEERALPALLAESRKRQANVTNELADQVFEALLILLAGFEAAAERDGRQLLDDALEREEDGDHLYQGLLTVLLRLVFVLYAEDRSLLPVDHPIYARSMSALGLFEQLQEDFGAFPDSMSRRFGAWSRLVALFRSIYLGVSHGDPSQGGLDMPPRRGELFDPHRFPFLEGWGPAGGAPITQAEDRAAVRVPTLDDLTVFQVLEKLLIFEGQRLSYRTLDVEQIGSVYEALMGYHVIRVPAPAVCLRPNRVWVTAEEVLDLPPTQRSKWLKDYIGLPSAQSDKLATAIKATKDPAEATEVLAEYSIAGRKKDRSFATAQAGRLVVQPGEERRRTSSHYTPRSLSAPIVARTLEPLLATMGDAPPSERILDLKICDPAMGSGAFLVEACRFLADHLVTAWTREGRLADIAASHDHGDPVMHARRLVAQRCLYGVDKNASAVTLAKLSLWLVTLARDLPFTFLDHSLRHGDSLVGLNFDQIRSFHWKPAKPGQQLELCRRELDAALDEAIALRQRIVDLAHQTGPVVQREKERLLFDANDAIGRVRLIGDLIVGAFFAGPSDKARETERQRRLDLVLAWLDEGGSPPEELIALQAQLLERLPPFHWMVEYPEIFYIERPDPLEHGAINKAAFMDAFVGNPPFAGKNNISAAGGPGYLDWLLQLHEGSHGNADLVAHFFRRGDTLLGKHGTIGLIATNTIAQGDTRTTALLPLVRSGHVIYDATRSMAWPGAAAVTIAVVHLARGTPAQTLPRFRLEGQQAPAISSRLRPVPERADPTILVANAGSSYVGSYVLGMGFTLTPEEREELVRRSPRNAERIFPYLGGKEVNSNPDQGFDRYVINFGQMSLDEAADWPDLLNIVREKVKPERDKNNRQTYRDYWWHFGEKRPALYEAIRGLERCLVTARTSKHMAFSLQPSDRVFSENLIVFPVSHFSFFATLQCRVHSTWVGLTASSLETRQGYRPTDCFETFPFPHPDPRAVISELEEAGQGLYDARAAYMLDPAVWAGFTTTYNRLMDPDYDGTRIAQLRRLHEEMDRAVLRAYGWDDIEVPPFCPRTDADHQAIEAFQDEVIDRTFVLNAQRAEDERLKGTSAKANQKGKPKPSVRGKRSKAGKAGKQSDQADLFYTEAADE